MRDVVQWLMTTFLKRKQHAKTYIFREKIAHTSDSEAALLRFIIFRQYLSQEIKTAQYTKRTGKMR